MQLAVDKRNLEREMLAIKKEADFKDEELRESILIRKQLHNQLEDLKGNIRVFCRKRPISESEAKIGSKDIVEIPDEMTCNVLGRNGLKSFKFDAVFGVDST